MPTKKAIIKKVKEEKVAEKTDKPELSKEKEKQQDTQLFYIILFMALALLAVFGFSYIYKNAGNFKYNEMYFEKTKYGELNMYKTQIFITNQYGKVKYSLYLRNDPRRLKMPVYANISLKNNVIIAFEPDISKCYASNLASFNLGSLLGVMGVNVKGATTSKQLAEEQNLVYADCETAINQTVIVFRNIQGNESSITQKGNCYELNIAGCQVVETAEKFELELVNQLILKTSSY